MRENIYVIINNLVPGADFNPACINFSESEARLKKLWRDERAMPTMQEIEAENDRIEAEKEAVKYKELRKKEYLKQNLTFERFMEALIEDDVSEIAAFRSARDAIKQQFPKP